MFFADPAFDAPSAAQPAGAGSAASPVPSPIAGRPELEPLSETDAQVGKCALLLRGHGWTTSAYIGRNAAKPMLFKAHGPAVLHIATHGYFLGDLPSVREGITQLDSPLIRSLLFFAGADTVWAHHEPTITFDAAHRLVFQDDGILTAFEAATLDLHGTRLVVLSACETGLGSLAAGEGVVGMRRALQEAGASSVLMTLWEVPTAETTELLDLFYTKWIGAADECAALRAAQREMRARIKRRQGYDEPYKWAAFVLVGRH